MGLRSEQTFVTAAMVIVSSVAILAAFPAVSVFLRVVLLVALVVVAALGYLSVKISQAKATRFEQLLHVVTREDRAAAPTQFDYITAAIVSWPRRESLREQVIDLIRNARNAANALRGAPEEKYVEVLAQVAPAFTDPVVAIRRALQNMLGYSSTFELQNLSLPKEADDFDRLADAHEALLRLIAADVPAIRLNALVEEKSKVSAGNEAPELTEQA